MFNSIVKSPTVSFLLRVLLGLLTVALIILIFYVYHHGGWKEALLFYRYFFNFKRLQAFIASFGPWAWLIFICVQALQVVFAPVPGEVTGFVGGLLFGIWSGTLLSTIGLTLGSLFAFAIARIFGADFVHKIVKREYIDRFDYFVTHQGLYIAYLLFLIPGFPKDSLCYLLGLTTMRYFDFIMMNLVGRLPGTLILGLEGNAVRNEQYNTFFIWLIVSVLFVGVLYVTKNYMIVLYGYVKGLSERKKKDQAGEPNTVPGKDVE